MIDSYINIFEYIYKGKAARKKGFLNMIGEVPIKT